MNDLSSLLTGSRALTSHLSRPDLPYVNLSLDQIEAQSRRLVSRQPTAPADHGKANYLLAKANVDAPTLASSIAALDTAHTFSPLKPLHDTDVAGFLRHAHEQSLISSIEEGRRETEMEFHRVLDERARKDWETRKKRIFEELGVARGMDLDKEEGDEAGRAMFTGANVARRSARVFGSGAMLPSQPPPTLSMHTKMMSYDRVVGQLNAARLGGSSFPIISAFMDAASKAGGDSTQFRQMLHVLSSITDEPPDVPRAHAQAHILNSASLERAFARAYLGPTDSPASVELRRKIVSGSRKALEEQYWNLVETTIQHNPIEASLGGDPGAANKIRAFLSVRFYKNGQWEEKLELIHGQPLWAKIFYLIRTGHIDGALEIARESEAILEQRERFFTTYLKTWADSPDRHLPKTLRDRLLASYHSHILHVPDTDPFKLALFKLLGRIDPQRRSVPFVTATTEDWIWFQLAMVDEDEAGGLAELGRVLEGYGKKHFEGAQNGKSKKGLWASLLLVCGLFEKAVAALYETPELQIEAVHLAIALSYYGLLRVPSKAESSDLDILTSSPVRPPALNFPLLIHRYIRQFQRTDPKEALQYVYCVPLNADRGAGVVGREEQTISQQQVEIAREMVRGILLASEGKWDELVGGFREDGTRYPGLIEHNLLLLRLKSPAEYKSNILLPTAEQSQQTKRLLQAIQLYNLAGAHDTVIGTLTHAIGECLSDPVGSGDNVKELESLARTVLEHYSRRGDAVGKPREELVRLLKIREAMEAYDQHKYDTALEAIEASGLIPLDGDIPTITSNAEEFKDHDDAITRNLSEILLLTMNILHGQHGRLKHSLFGDGARQTTMNEIRKKTRALMMFAGVLRFRMSADVYGQLARLDVAIAH